MAEPNLAAVRIGIVDDDPLTRQILKRMCDKDPRVVVVGEASDSDEARQMIKSQRPDVITLDIDLPGTNGLTFLHNLMRLNRMPVVVVSSYVGVETSVELNALSLGAIDILPKPPGRTTLADYREGLLNCLLTAATVDLDELLGRAKRPAANDSPPAARSSVARGVIAIGASTGGNPVLRQILPKLSPELPPVLIAQHLPGSFVSGFVQSLDACTPAFVLEAFDGLVLHRGHIYVAPADHHLAVSSDGRVRLTPVTEADAYCPLVDKLFLSVADHFGSTACVVLLSGMGEDGAKGMAAVSKAGGLTIAQDEGSSVVWGMPGAAVRIGAARHVLPAEEIANLLCQRMMTFA